MSTHKIIGYIIILNLIFQTLSASYHSGIFDPDCNEFRCEKVRFPKGGYFNVQIRDIKSIAEKLAENEFSCNLDSINDCDLSKMVFWNPAEDFPSLGLTHAIWPNSSRKDILSVFPKMIRFMFNNSKQLKQMILNEERLKVLFDCDEIDCKQGLEYSPWNDRTEFEHDQKTREILTAFLSSKEAIRYQSLFVIMRYHNSIVKIVSELFVYGMSINQLEKILNMIKAISLSETGLTCLYDYVNFKGEGLKKANNPWGLKQVLKEMVSRQKENPDLEINVNFYLSSAQILFNRAWCKNMNPLYMSKDGSNDYDKIGCQPYEESRKDARMAQFAKGFESRLRKTCLPYSLHSKVPNVYEKYFLNNIMVIPVRYFD